MNESTSEDAATGRASFDIRQMEPGDSNALLDFAKRLPVADLVFLPRDIRQSKVVEAWTREMEDGNLTTLLAYEGDAVAGCSTVARDPLSWSRHVAEIRCVVSLAARSQGIGSNLIRQAFRLALLTGAEKIVAQMTTDQTGAISTFEGLGFTPEAILRDHVKDEAGTAYDLAIFAHRVRDVASGLEAYGLGAAG